MLRNAIRTEWSKWPDGVVPYVIYDFFDEYERYVISQAMAEYKQHTCVRFVPRTGQRDYVAFVKKNGCYSNVGRTGGVQEVSLGYNCLYKGIVIHELMHAIGEFYLQLILIK